MQKKLSAQRQYLFAILTFVLFTTFSSSAFGVCFNYNSTMNAGQNQTISASISAQAYYWSVSGPISIVGSRTGSSVTIHANGSGTGTVTLNTYTNGSCSNCGSAAICIVNAPCNYTIDEWQEMCSGQLLSRCAIFAGEYIVKDCQNNTIAADWEVSHNNGPFCMQYGCQNNGTGRFFGTVFRPYPLCNMVGQIVTVRAYQHGTNTLLASISTLIDLCDGGCKVAPTTSGGTSAEQAASQDDSQLFNLSLPANGPVKVTALNLLTGSEKVLFNGPGKKLTDFSFQIASNTLEMGKLYAIRIVQNGLLLESRKVRMDSK